MDPFDERILGALRDSRSRDCHQLLGEVGFSYNTLRLHLNTLVEKGLINKEKIPVEGRGRPKFIYSMSQGGSSLASGTFTGLTEVVTIPFKGLKRLCC